MIGSFQEVGQMKGTIELCEMTKCDLCGEANVVVYLGYTVHGTCDEFGVCACRDCLSVAFRLLKDRHFKSTMEALHEELHGREVK